MILKNNKKEYLQSILGENFEVIKILGESSNSGVALVRNKKLSNRKENIKFIESLEPNERKKFVEEGKTLSKLNHNNIPKVYDIDEKEDLLLIRSQHIEGTSLKKYKEKKAIRIILKLARALNYTHEKKIVHCDIKPSNILLDKDEPYLIDFGIANLKGHGTRKYFSPEQTNNKPPTWKTDIYQLMLILEEITDPKISKSLIKKVKEDKFKTEGDFLEELKALRIKQIVKTYSKPVLLIITALIIILISPKVYTYWDYKTNSIDTLVKNVPKNATMDQLKHSLEKIQKRAFEKKYLEPLLEGKFREDNGNPAYPSYLGADGEWILVGPNTNAAGAFVGLLFNYSKRYPEILPYAIEYAEPILNSEFDGSNTKRFAYALIPAYEITGNKKYLDKLIDVSKNLISDWSSKSGYTSITDMHQVDLFIKVYRFTNNAMYFYVIEEYVDEFIKNNIEEDGYLSDNAAINATSPYGPIPDMKFNRLIAPYDIHGIGNFIIINNNSLYNITSVFSFDFIETIYALEEMYNATENLYYKEKEELIYNYYIKNNKGEDYLFVLRTNESEIPLSSLTTVMYVKYLSKDYSRMKKLLTFIKKENENGILNGNVIIENYKYEHENKEKNNQTSIVTDSLFLQI